MKNEQQYTEALIEKYNEALSSVDTLSSDIIKCAIIDVENTIDALEGLECNYYRTRYFNNVLQILKDKL